VTKKKPVAIKIARAHDIGLSCSRTGVVAVTCMGQYPFQTMRPACRSRTVSLHLA